MQKNGDQKKCFALNVRVVKENIGNAERFISVFGYELKSLWNQNANECYENTRDYSNDVPHHKSFEFSS